MEVGRLAVMTDLARSERRGGGALWYVVGAVGCAVVAGYAAVSMVTAARRETVVVIARQEVPPLAEVTAADVALVKVPVAALPVGAMRSIGAAVGQWTRMGLVPGEMVTTQALTGGVTDASAFDTRLAHLAGIQECPAQGSGQAVAPAPAPAEAQGPTTSSSTEVGCRDLVAMALPTTADQGYQIVHAGDHVDVAAAYTVKQGPVSQIVVENVPVIDKIDNAQGTAPTVPGSKAAAAGASSGWLVLGLSPDQAIRLQLAQSAGKVAVLLQAPGAPVEPPSVGTELVSPETLSGGASALQAAPAVAGQLGQGGGALGPRG